MTMKFRIKHVEGLGYFAQVKPHWFSGWKTIGKHVHGYGIYDEDYIDHPLENIVFTENLCIAYSEFKGKKKTTYTYL